LKTLLTNKFEFLYQKEQHPTWWDNVPFWEFEEYIKLLNERNKEESIFTTESPFFFPIRVTNSNLK